MNDLHSEHSSDRQMFMSDTSATIHLHFPDYQGETSQDEDLNIFTGGKITYI